MRSRLTPLLLLQLGLLLGLCSVLPIGRANADNQPTVQAVTQAYNADTSLQRGILVRISASDKTKVQPVPEKAAADLSGVVVAANDAAVTLSDPSATSRQVFVAGAGRYAVLVSNQNGAIKANDYLVVSSLDGIAMKAGASQSTVVGKALTAFNGDSASGQATLKASDGSSRKVAIGLVSVDISIGSNPLQRMSSNQLPGISYLQRAAGAIVNKAVDPARLYISLVIVVAVAAIAGSILYAGIRSSINAIGRNPLAKSSIVRGLVQVVLTSIIIFIIGLLGIYLILKL